MLRQDPTPRCKKNTPLVLPYLTNTFVTVNLDFFVVIHYVILGQVDFTRKVWFIASLNDSPLKHNMIVFVIIQSGQALDLHRR
jgi:hypothetical protein